MASDEARSLDDELYEQISRLCRTGDELAANERFREALVAYNDAWKLLPEPRTYWNASTWVLAAIADSAYLGGFNVTAREALDYAMSCPDAVGNPFLHLRRGEVLYEQGHLDAAAEELIRAYMGGGPELFETEDEKYLTFLSTRANL